MCIRDRLKVGDATREGAGCIANGLANNVGFDGRNATNANSLCPEKAGEHAIVQFTGVPNAVITVERTIETQEQNGVRFTHHDGRPFQNVHTIVLDGTNGTGSTTLWSGIFLFDSSLVTDAVMEFSYDISAAYQ